MKYDYLLFDLDNTLMDFTGAARKAFSSALEHYAIKENDQHFHIYEEVNQQVWKDFEANKIDAVTLRHRRFHHFFMETQIKGLDPMEFNYTFVNCLIQHSDVLDGAFDLLEKLKGKTKMAIITNGLKEAQRPRLKASSLDQYFDTIVVSDEIGYSKPDAQYFDLAMQACGFPKKEKTLVIGDNMMSDIKGGVNYGLPTCWFNIKKKENKTDFKANFECHNFNELERLLLK